MSRELLVWIFLPGQQHPTQMGLFSHEQITQEKGRGSFAYLDAYLARPDSVAVCPPFALNDNVYETHANGGFFGFMLDAGPDAWGKEIIDRTTGQQDAFGYLLRASKGLMTGAITFSDPLSDEPSTIEVPQAQDLDALQQAALRIELGLPVDPNTERLLRPSLSIGGARPKTIVRDDGHLWVAKFMSTRDSKTLPAVPRLEYAMLELARKMQIQTPDSRLIEISGQPVLLSKRFDLCPHPEGGFTRLRYASARTAQERPGMLPSYTGSYPLLARSIQTWSERASQDAEALFRRMIFNIAISNTDDHELNHGFVDHPSLETADQLILSPAFDLTPILPTTQRVYQAMVVGEQGPLSDYENALSSAESFGLDWHQARRIIQQISETVHDQWRCALLEAGVEREKHGSLERCFTRLDPLKPLAPKIRDRH